MYNVVSGGRGREGEDLEEARGSKRKQEEARGCKRMQEEPEGQEEQEEPEGAEGAEYSEYSELADTACRVPTTLSLTCRFHLSVQRSTLNAQR